LIYKGKVYRPGTTTYDDGTPASSSIGLRTVSDYIELPTEGVLTLSDVRQCGSTLDDYEEICLYEAVSGQEPADDAQSLVYTNADPGGGGTTGTIYQVKFIPDTSINTYSYSNFIMRYNPNYVQYVRVITVDSYTSMDAEYTITTIGTVAGVDVTNALIKENTDYLKLTNYIDARIPSGKYTTIPIDWYHGNCYYSSALTQAGLPFALGKGETSVQTIASSRLYAVTANTTVSFNGASNLDPTKFNVLFFDDEYLTTAACVTGKTTWNSYTMTVPQGSTMMAVQYICDSGNIIENPNIDMTFIMDKDKPTRFFPRPSDDGYQHLTIKIAIAGMLSNPDDDPTDSYTGTTYAIDHGVLCLPESYNPNGAPTRLICFTHGHAVQYGPSATRFDSTDIKPEYWLSEGYAIFDMDGTVTGSFSGNHDYEANSFLCYDNAYKWIVSHYNICTDGVFTSGRSMGGGMQFLLAKRSCMPIIASCPLVCVTQPLGYFDRSITGAARKDLLASYGVPADELNAVTWSSSSQWFYEITQAERQCIENNQFRFMPLMPGYCYDRPLTDAELCKYSEAYATRNTTMMDEFYDMVKDSVDISIYRDIPFRMFTCITDPTVWYYGITTHCKTLANAGSFAQVHVFPKPQNTSITDHRFEINPDNLVTYTNSKGVTLNNVPTVYIEALAFWRKFESAAK